MDPALARLLLKTKRLVVRIDTPSSRRRGPRAGSLPSRLVDWARRRGKPFRTQDVAKALKIKPRHASVLLVHAVKDGRGIVRTSHGVYAYTE